MSYVTAIVVADLILSNPFDTELTLDVPAKVYGHNYRRLNRDLTHKTADLSYENMEVLAKIDIRPEDLATIQADPSYLGLTMADVHPLGKYISHYNIKRKDKWATYDENDNPVLYNGPDKESLAPFCKWEGDGVQRPGDPDPEPEP